MVSSTVHARSSEQLPPIQPECWNSRALLYMDQRGHAVIVRVESAQWIRPFHKSQPETHLGDKAGRGSASVAF